MNANTITVSPSVPALAPAAIIAVISYDPNSGGNSRIRVGLTELCKGMLSTLTDLELKVFAVEVGLHVSARLEAPSSRYGS